MAATRSRWIAGLAVLALCGWAGSASADEVLRTRAQFDDWLAAHPEYPLNALSPGARERVLLSLKFNENGLVGMDSSDIADELDDSQIHALMGPFGERVLAYAPKSRAQETRIHDGGAKDPIGDVERRYNDFYRATAHLVNPDPGVRERRRIAAFAAHLGHLFSPGALRRLSDHELRLLRRAARELAIGTRLPPYVTAFENLFGERTRRKLVSIEDVRWMRDLYLALHRFAAARRLTARHSDSGLPPLPRFRDSIADARGQPTLWRFEDAGRRATRAAVDLAPLQILVTASCHLSKDAARDIAGDALLGPVFARHARWLVPAPGQESVQAAQEWNRELPATPVAMIYDRKEWSVLPHWRMPTFFIVRGGEVIDSSDGWASGDTRTRDGLIAALRRTGLLPAE